MAILHLKTKTNQRNKKNKTEHKTQPPKTITTENNKKQNKKQTPVNIQALGKKHKGSHKSVSGKLHSLEFRSFNQGV